jgi:hypothetical protein
MILRLLKILSLILIAVNAVGQKEQHLTDFTYYDKYNVSIRVTSSSKLSIPLDSSFIIKNITSKNIISTLDTSRYEYELLIDNIVPVQTNVYSFKVNSYTRWKEDRRGKFQNKLYRLRIKKADKKYKLDKIEYLTTEI